MVAVRLFVEGGGDSKSLRSACRRGFSEFFRKAGLQGTMPRIIASGSRHSAYKDFCTALSQFAGNACILLLVDSESPVAEGDGTWSHLRRRSEDRWDRPAKVNDAHCHLMVQCMESWFLADPGTLSTFFGKGFNEKALPKRSDIEAIPKPDVLKSLRNATRLTKTRGGYRKGTHAFAVLALIDPIKVRRMSCFADQLLKVLASPKAIR